MSVSAIDQRSQVFTLAGKPPVAPDPSFETKPRSTLVVSEKPQPCSMELPLVLSKPTLKRLQQGFFRGLINHFHPDKKEKLLAIALSGILASIPSTIYSKQKVNCRDTLRPIGLSLPYELRRRCYRSYVYV